jgi:hypothetical protein
MRYSIRVAIFDSISTTSNIRYVKAQDVAGWPLVLYVETDPHASGFVRGGCPRGTRFTKALLTSLVFSLLKDVGICGDLMFTQYPQIPLNTLPQKYSTVIESF